MPLLDAALDGFIKSEPQGSWVLGVAKRNSGECLMKLKDYPRAKVMLEDAYKTSVDALGKEHKRAQQAAATLAQLYELMGDAVQAQHWKGLAGSQK